MEILTLNDGTELNGHVLESGNGQVIFVYLDNMNLIDGFNLFANKNRTRHIVANNRGTIHEYDGYTEIVSVSAEFGNCNLTMQKEQNNEQIN